MRGEDDSQSAGVGAAIRRGTEPSATTIAAAVRSLLPATSWASRNVDCDGGDSIKSLMPVARVASERSETT